MWSNRNPIDHQFKNFNDHVNYKSLIFKNNSSFLTNFEYKLEENVWSKVDWIKK